ncbi:sensor histidine kinase [Herbivorax sp. ANBcel31]|uniref:sensor histidine kinase n=1 Tax=Herbivorax sp. ANBcel31 TaxID=3069754 RepID=UPI0027B5FE4D|nr:sensor histidine kinase [Herbivorax sp. ANBcel31]MDQ2087642.1 sensor histidine kinase [Herbivorax sp. ANBcel31]
MANFKLDIANLDSIIKKTVEAINNSKSEIYDIAEGARKECGRLEYELEELKKLVLKTMSKVSFLENEMKESKKELMILSKNHDKHSEEKIKKAYEKTDELRVQLLISREMERHYINRRNDLEIRLKEAYKTLKKADSLISNVSVSLECLTGDLHKVSVKLEDVQQRQLIGLKIIKAQEEERQRVARDIHDGPAQSMSNAIMKAEICERLVESEPVKTKSELKNLKFVVRNTLRDVRRIIYDLRPMSLDDLGLIPTLQRHIETYQEESDTIVVFKTRGFFKDLKPIISLTVFRLVQEAISNVKKHANAKNVTINLEFLKRELTLNISDDGRGFDASVMTVKNESDNSGFGLFSMKERVELLGGNFEIDSAIGEGTNISIDVPLIPEEEVSNG